MEKPVYIVIPAYEPKAIFCAYAKELQEKKIGTLVVVDDGSNENYKDIFKQVKSNDNTILLTHERNFGKGQALKTAYQYIKDHGSKDSKILCVDCDGQHTIDDIQNIVSQMDDYPSTLILGARDFSLENIPLRSRFGNRSTSFLFMLVSGKWIGDTQTGFRAFDYSLLDELLSIEGTRFEYEMQVLATFMRKKLPLVSIPIETVYENNNEGSHFHTFKDSYRVMKTLFGSLVKFAISSFSSCVVDVVAFTCLLNFVFEATTLSRFTQIACATCLARVISMITNYCLNRNLVFKQGSKQNTFIKYLVLCIVIMLMSACSVYILTTLMHWNESITKIICDGILFFASYKVQRDWVFKN